MWPVNPRTHTAVGSPHRVVIRVEVWRGAEQLSADADITDGSVDDAWASGPRRTLSLTVPATTQWRAWLSLGVEIRPYRGVDFGGGVGVTEMCPLGRFPVLAFSNPRVASTLSVRAVDKWDQIAAATFGAPRASSQGLVRDSIAGLLAEVDPYGTTVTNTATSTAPTPAVLWDKTRAETILELAKSIGAEVFYDRLGQPVLRDRAGVAAASTVIRTGAGGNAVALTESVDWAGTFNAVTVFASNTDTALPPVTVAISDPLDPAHRSHFAGGNPGGGWRARRYASPVFTTAEQMVAVARTELLRTAGPAKRWAITCVPDPSLDASDTVSVELLDGSFELAQIQSVSHPLVAGTAQTISTVSTREDVA